MAAAGCGERAAARLAVAVLEPVVDAAARAGGVTIEALTLELTTVSDDHAVAFDGMEVRAYDGLQPSTDYEYDGLTFRTLERPPGERLSTIATVNDVHFGETICGLDGNRPEEGPVFSVEPGEPPYPETMNSAAVEEIAALSPAADLVVAKGDLTSDGKDEEYAAFLRCYAGAFGDRLVHIRGNHDAYRGQTFADFGPQRRDVPGATMAMIDTTIPRSATGRVTGEQIEWLDAVGADAGAGGRADRPVLVFGHHHAWDPGARTRPDTYYGIHPDSSEALVDVFVRRPALMGYFAGHTHRNRVRRFVRTGGRPWVEVACVKDFPGAWAEYRVFEGGILQVVHRVRRPDALAWTERTRGMFGGSYPAYAFGALEDRCFRVT